MDQRTAQILEDVKGIVETRTAMAETLGLIERRLTDSIEEVKQSTAEFIEHTKQAVSPAHQATHHPWAFLGGSVLVGLIIAKIASSRGQGTRDSAGRSIRVPMFSNEGRKADRSSSAYHSDRSSGTRHQNDVPSGNTTGNAMAEHLGDIKQQLMVAAGAFVSMWLRNVTPIIIKKLNDRFHSST